MKKLIKRINFTKIKTWQLYLPLLVVANAAYLSHSFLGSIITVCFFSFVPGFLFLSRLKHEIESRWEIASFSLGLSILLLMIGGLALNSLYLIGLKQPLTTMNIFIMLDLVTFILLTLNKNLRVKFPKIHFSFPKEKTIFTLILTFLPFLSAGGAITLNNGGSNIFTMILFALIAIIFALLIWRKNLESLYPYAIFTIGLSILFTTSLRGWSITGHDIHHEFAVFQITNENNFWPVRTPSHDPYNACLSITILPTIIAKITNISAPYVFKFVFQIIFAFSLVSIYLFIQKLSNSISALVGSFIFILFPPFLNDMPFLNRQEIAFVFFSLLMLTTFLKMKNKPKNILTIASLLGLIVSHYSSNYVALIILISSWVLYNLLKRIQRIKQSFVLPVLNLQIIAIALVLTFLWNSQVTASTIGLTQTIRWTINGLVNNVSKQSNGVTYALFSRQAQDPKKLLANYAGNHASEVKYLPEQNLPVTNLGKVVSHIVNVETLNNLIRAFSAKVLQVLFLFGLIILFFRQRKNASQKEGYFYTLAISCLLLLTLIIILPQLSVDYSVTRLFQQALIIIALPIIVALEYLLGFFGRINKHYAIVVFFAFLFLHLSGFIPQILGGYPPQLALNNSGIYYDLFYVHDGELAATRWLDQQYTGLPLSADLYARLRFLKYPFLEQHSVREPIFSGNRSEYLFQDYANLHKGVYAKFLSGNLIEYSYLSQTTNGNLLYSNQDSRIYEKR